MSVDLTSLIKVVWKMYANEGYFAIVLLSFCNTGPMPPHGDKELREYKQRY